MVAPLLDPLDADPDSRTANRLMKVAIWTFAAIELAVMILAYALRDAH